MKKYEIIKITIEVINKFCEDKNIVHRVKFSERTMFREIYDFESLDIMEFAVILSNKFGVFIYSEHLFEFIYNNIDLKNQGPATPGATRSFPTLHVLER